MRINEDCIACGICEPYCPVGAIQEGTPVYLVDEDLCVECGVCRRTAGCPTESFVDSPGVHEWPRNIRAQFSDPMVPHPHTKGLGRGTEEMKTNDVTGRYQRGMLGLAMEFGRPGIATRLSDVEIATKAMARAGACFEPQNPVFALMSNPDTGEFKPEVRNERCLSAIVEAGFPAGYLPRIMEAVREVSGQVNTVFSLDLITRFEADGSIAVLPELEELGIKARPNAKINMGLGRPFIA